MISISRANAIKKLYFSWLISFVSNAKDESIYSKLFMQLHSTPFRWIIKGDDNRALDGRNFRQRFGISYDLLPEEMDIIENEPISILEVMVAFAERVELETMFNPMIGDRTGFWFWSMIHNLNLGEYTNEQYDGTAVNNSLQKMLNRTYSYNGLGGLWPLKEPNRDQRKVEIWYQFNAWVIENGYL